MIKVSTTGMAVSLKTDLRFPISGQWGHGDRIIHEEERFIGEVQEWYQQKEGKIIGRDEVVDAINNLYGIKAADFNDGNIYLKEHVWGTVE